MKSIHAVGLNGNSLLLDATILDNFKASLRGGFVTPDDTEYEKLRTVWNGMINHFPALIIQCTDSSDVVKAVRFAGEHNLLLSVKCGGHNFAGLSVCKGGIMIDLSNMRTITVDPIGKTARAEGGALLCDLDKETQAFGLATTSGTVSNTGIGGLTLGGGQGWMMNKYGLTCDNLIAADIVTADGQIRRASKDENPDLFWALRGGGGNFGVVTSFEYKLHAIGPIILGGVIMYPIDQAKKALQFFREFSMSTPEELTMMAGFLSLPDGTPVIALAAGWMGDIEEGKKVIQPLQEFGAPVANMIGEIPYLQLQAIFDAAVPHGLRRYAKMGYVQKLSDEFIDTVINYWNKKTSAYSLVLFNTMKGAVSRVNPTETPFFHRNNQWYYDIVPQWTESEEEEMHINWARAFWKDTSSFTKGASINFLAGDDGSDRVKLSFGDNYERLAAIKAKYDPDNLFRLNANIIPKVKELDVV
jgi:FAD/FMN-containing dehydrogenase